MIKNTDTEFIRTQTVALTKDSGVMVNSMAKVSLSHPKANKEGASGTRVSVSNGLKTMSNSITCNSLDIIHTNDKNKCT